MIHRRRGAKLDRVGTPICVGDFVRVAKCLYSVTAHQEFRADFRRCAGRVFPVVGWDQTGVAWIPNGKMGVLSVEPQLLRVVRRGGRNGYRRRSYAL
jgi:hypothetical protein